MTLATAVPRFSGNVKRSGSGAAGTHAIRLVMIPQSSLFVVNHRSDIVSAHGTIQISRDSLCI